MLMKIIILIYKVFISLLLLICSVLFSLHLPLYDLDGDYAQFSSKCIFFFFSSNLFNKVSPVVSYKVDLAVLAAVEIRG